MANRFTNKTSGRAIRISGARIRLAGSATGRPDDLRRDLREHNDQKRDDALVIDSTMLSCPNVRSAIDVVSTGMMIRLLLPIMITESN